MCVCVWGDDDDHWAFQESSLGIRRIQAEGCTVHSQVVPKWAGRKGQLLQMMVMTGRGVYLLDQSMPYVNRELGTIQLWEMTKGHCEHSSSAAAGAGAAAGFVRWQWQVIKE